MLAQLQAMKGFDSVNKYLQDNYGKSMSSEFSFIFQAVAP